MDTLENDEETCARIAAERFSILTRLVDFSYAAIDAAYEKISEDISNPDGIRLSAFLNEVAAATKKAAVLVAAGDDIKTAEGILRSGKALQYMLRRSRDKNEETRRIFKEWNEAAEVLSKKIYGLEDDVSDEICV